ncbi:MAG TPA: SDR family NAD(P)-dependent oxidoreductase, partial [Phenylobacterium sp.]|nr:SDR family NAD(P)-dependent oxidoreductase [Phenylobacterium sp.]
MTGAAGLGFETARELARAGAHGIMVSRNATTGAEAVARILSEMPQASVRFEPLDLGSLASVAGFADRLLTDFGFLPEPRLDPHMLRADMLVFPYRHIDSSGAFLSALH